MNSRAIQTENQYLDEWTVLLKNPLSPAIDHQNFESDLKQTSKLS